MVAAILEAQPRQLQTTPLGKNSSGFLGETVGGSFFVWPTGPIDFLRGRASPVVPTQPRLHSRVRRGDATTKR